MYHGEDREGKPITNCDIFAYVKDGKYPADYTKDEKRALRKRAKFFVKVGESEWCCSKINTVELNTGHLATCSTY